MRIISKKCLALFASLLMLGAMWSCQTRPDMIFPDGDAIFGLASPVQLEGDTTKVYLTDYFVMGTEADIDSVTGTERLGYLLADDRQELHIVARSNFIPHLSEMKIWKEGTPYSIMVKRSKREQFTFRFDPQGERYRRVALRGEMNDWNAGANPMHLIDGVWQTELDLNPGRYQYQIRANGEDMLDPNNPNVVDNNVGGYNSLLEVGQVDRDVAPRLYPESHRRYKVNVAKENEVDEVFVFWQNFRLPDIYVTSHDGQILIQVPGDAAEEQRSFLRIWAQNEHGPSNDLLIPLEYGRPVTDPEQLTREDKEATIMYFLMIDRFYNGNPDNDEPVDDPEVAERANYHGGDLAGIRKKIEEGYFEMLGMNTIWTTPITQNPLDAYREYPEPQRKYTGYHGYWPVTLTTVDHRFGTDEELEELLGTAHDNEMNMLLDFVSNHVHEENQLIKDNPDWSTTLNLPDGRKNIRLWHDHRLTTWFDTFLPSLDYTKPEVTDLMSDSAFYWIENFHYDGFRHDATKHVHLEFWREMTRKLKEDYMIPENRRLFQIGETFGSRELIGEYVGSGLLDGQFDFNLYFDARSVFAQEETSFETLDYSIYQTFDHYGYQNLMGNITGNHDLPRFISLAGGDLRFDEDDTEAGWEREIGVGDPVGYDRLSQLTAFIMTIPGVPVLYYGDEIGIPGASDPDCRRPMKFENLTERQKDVRDKAARLAHLRKDNLAFIYGDFETRKLDQHIWVYSRSYFGENAIVIFNKSDEDKTIHFDIPEKLQQTEYDAHFGHEFAVHDNAMELTVRANSYEVLTGR